VSVLRKLFSWVTITSLGVAALVFGLLAAVLDHRDSTSGLQVGRFLENFYRENRGTLVGIGITVLILDQLYKRREDQEKRVRLTKALASPDPAAALTALEALRTEEWLDDETLLGINLHEARLEGADLHGANLRGAYLAAAELAGAKLGRADLRGANLTDASLRGADLRGARLVGATLDGADLTAADLSRTDVEDDQLASAHALLDATLPDGECYDGRFDLAGDRELAVRLGFATGDSTAMAQFYAVPLATYAHTLIDVA